MTTTTPTEAKLLTAADLLRLDGEGVRGELIQGVLCETMPAGHEHGGIVTKLVIRLGNSVEQRRGERLSHRTRACGLIAIRTRRAPDIAFTSAEKVPLDSRITPKWLPTWSSRLRPRETAAATSMTRRICG